MGIFRGSATLIRYRADMSQGKPSAPFLDECIRNNAFRSIDDGTEELATGWVNAADALDAEFVGSPFWLDPYVLLGFRIDRRKVPAAILKKHHRLEIKKAREMMDEGQTLSRTHREELKEKARMDLLRRIPPTYQVFDMVWDTSTGKVLLGGSGATVREFFEDAFRSTFEARLKPVFPWTLAKKCLVSLEANQALEDARPLSTYHVEE